MNVRRWKAALVFLAMGSCLCEAADWPQFRGIRRDGRSEETGLLRQWPEGGPGLAWSVDGLGDGYSSAAVAGGRVYTTGMIDKVGYVFCFDTQGGRKWRAPYGDEYTKSYPASRTTPTVNDGRLYVFSGMGVVVCLDAETGGRVWSRDVFTEFDGQWPRWGMSECLLIDGDRVICTPGGTRACMAALDKRTGEVVWTCTDINEPSTYGNPICVEYAGYRIIVQMLRDSVVGVDAESGRLLWRDSLDDYHIDRTRWVNANVPLYRDGCIYTTSGYDNGGAMIQLSADPRRMVRRWVDKTLDTHHGGTVLVDGYIYGSNFKSMALGDWACLEWETGKVMYDEKWQGNRGSLVYADGMLYCYDENKGDVALVAATPDEFRPVSQFRVTQGGGRHWAHPSISDGLLYIRHGDCLMAYDIRRK